MLQLTAETGEKWRRCGEVGRRVKDEDKCCVLVASHRLLTGDLQLDSINIGTPQWDTSVMLWGLTCCAANQQGDFCVIIQLMK